MISTYQLIEHYKYYKDKYLTAHDVSGDSECEWCGAVRVTIVIKSFKPVIVRVRACDMADMLFACSRCFSRHPFEELSQGQQLCKVG